MDTEVIIPFMNFAGREVAEYAKKHFPEELLKQQSYKDKQYADALTKAFLQIDVMLAKPEGRKEIAELIKDTNKDPAKRSEIYEGDEDAGPEGRGCTANVMLIVDKKMYVANAGDSRAILICKDGRVIEMSADHKPDLDKERTRISKAGGSVFNGRVDGNLNLSRALGDLSYKDRTDLKPEEQKISACPDVKDFPITPDLFGVLMGCDGVYERKTSSEIGEFILKEAKANPDLQPSVIAERLLDVLISPDYTQTAGAGCDNMSCILIKFKHS